MMEICNIIEQNIDNLLIFCITVNYLYGGQMFQLDLVMKSVLILAVAEKRYSKEKEAVK